ncbi:MAG: protein kinase [Propionibacteriales bacterium]|nr:protein kinase [Propionibacteriales bacterium]
MQPDFIAGRYRVVRAVGKGGMGTVWLCTDETLHRQVAVKQIGSLPGESPDDTARAMREARLAAALNHKNAVSIYDVVEHDGTTWLVMEYVPSQTLSELLASEGRLAPERVGHIGAQVAEALSSAHSRGIVHRDIKPGNILVGEGDAAKLSDFGIARGQQDAQLTQTGMVTGTPGFFSPELARGEDPSFASDVWALGITLYTATEGGPPYEPQSNPLAMLSIITREPLPPPTHAGPLTGVLAGMLEPDASRRATIAEVLADLRAVEQEGRATRTSRGAAAVVAASPGAPERPDPTTSLEHPRQESVEPDYEKPVAVPAPVGGWSDEGAADEPPPPRERGRLGRVAMVALGLFVLVGAGALLWNTVGLGADDETDPTSSNSSTDAGENTAEGQSPQDTGSPSTNEPDTTTEGDEPTSAEDPTTSISEDPTTSISEDPTTSISEDPTTDPVVPPSGDSEAFTESYFATVPGNLDAGWSMLAPSYRQELGRGSYDGFWGTIESVELGSVDIDGNTVTYQITYTRTDGSTSEETKLLTLKPAGDSYLITSDQPAG